MNFLSSYCWLILLVALLTGCKDKKKPSLSGEDPVEISDFIDFFPEKKVPYQVGDTTLNKREKDSLLIGYKVFTQFVPDSFLQRVFGKGVKPKIYPMGRIKSPDDENYLFVKAISGDKKTVYVFVFDKKDQFMDGIQFLRLDQNLSTRQLGSIDRSYSINKLITRRNRDASVSEGKDVYGLNKESGKFMLIMTDPLDDKITEIINPIDTLSRKNKYAADYGTGKLNLVSIRDGRKSDRLSFFVHFEKNNGECTGELKGEAIIQSSNVAEYREGGDPCVLRFTFTSSSVNLKEVEGCGSRRGLRCSFDGAFARKKEPKPAKKKQAKQK
ncbi:MAG TPA: hypothetical protein VI461_13770 [Chitinophagaceae bacterium]|nr:hypothetical protein [Chitinophagaceae bacterium]